MILIRTIVRLAIRTALQSLSNDSENRTQLEYFPLEDLKTIYIQELYAAIKERHEKDPTTWHAPVQNTADYAGVCEKTVKRALNNRG